MRLLLPAMLASFKLAHARFLSSQLSHPTPTSLSASLVPRDPISDFGGVVGQTGGVLQVVEITSVPTACSVLGTEVLPAAAYPTTFDSAPHPVAYISGLYHTHCGPEESVAPEPAAPTHTCDMVNSQERNGPPQFESLYCRTESDFGDDSGLGIYVADNMFGRNIDAFCYHDSIAGSNDGVPGQVCYQNEGIIISRDSACPCFHTIADEGYGRAFSNKDKDLGSGSNGASMNFSVPPSEWAPAIPYSWWVPGSLCHDAMVSIIKGCPRGNEGEGLKYTLGGIVEYQNNIGAPVRFELLPVSLKDTQPSTSPPAKNPFRQPSTS